MGNRMIYQWRKGLATWVKADTLYISVPFTWLLGVAEKLASKWRGKVILGGPGIMQPSQYLEFEPIIFHNPCATFTTRGCPNSCGFCAVPKLEPTFIEKVDFRPAPVICDNNLLAASKRHIRYVVDALKQFPIVDFNQGLEAKRFTPEIADMLGELNCKVRFAFDDINLETVVHDAIELCKRHTSKDIQVYCLTGFNDTPEDAQYRLEQIRSWGVLPNPMRYQPLDAKIKNEYRLPEMRHWTEKQLMDTMRYYSRLSWLGYIPFKEYKAKRWRQEVMELKI